MELRAAKITDGYEIERLVKKCADSSGMMMVESSEMDGIISRLVINPNSSIYVALMDSQIVGVIVGISGAMFSNSHNMEVSMCVDPKWKRMGIGSLLMEHFILEHGWKNIYAEVVSDNEPIINLLTKFNYRKECVLSKFVRTRNGFSDKMIFIYNG